MILSYKKLAVITNVFLEAKIGTIAKEGTPFRTTYDKLNSTREENEIDSLDKSTDSHEQLKIFVQFLRAIKDASSDSALETIKNMFYPTVSTTMTASCGTSDGAGAGAGSGGALGSVLGVGGTAEGSTAGSSKRAERQKSRCSRAYVTEAGRLSVEFVDSDLGEFPALAGLKKWDNISKLAIITGINGSGKTQLLRCLQVKLSGNESSVLYIGPHHTFEDILKKFQNLSYNDAKGDKEYLKNLLMGSEEAYAKFLREPNQQRMKILVKTCFKDIRAEIVAEIKKTMQERGLNEEICVENKTIKALITKLANKLKVNKKEKALITEELEKYIDLMVSQKIDKVIADNFPYFKIPAEAYSSPIIVLQMICKQYVNLSTSSMAVGKDVTLFLNEYLPTPPWQELTYILQENNFDLEVDYNSGSELGELIFKHRGKTLESISYSKLSSGENMIIALMSWLYAFRINGLYTLGNSENLSPVIILDEPDKHLDPKLCKLFFDIVHEEFVEKQKIQVVMTTHRIDTLALAPEGSIFTIKQNKKLHTTVAPTTKLHAMFRLTHNLRELTNLHTKVYVEAHNDALFYESAYKALMRLSNEVRVINEENSSKAISKSGKSFWEITPVGINEYHNRVLSRRYQLSFYSSAFEKGEGGGCIAVEDLLRRDIASRETIKQDDSRADLSQSIIKNTKSEWLHRVLSQITKPFAILDYDYRERKFKFENIPAVKMSEEHKKGLRHRFVSTSRHSLENFILDPIILATSLSEKEIDEYINDETLKEALKGLKTSLARKIIDESEIICCVKDYYIQFAELVLKNKSKMLKEATKGTLKEARDFRKLSLEEINHLIKQFEQSAESCFSEGRQYNLEDDWKKLIFQKTDLTPQQEKEIKFEFEKVYNRIKPERLIQYSFLEEQKRLDLCVYDDIDRLTATKKITVLLNNLKTIIVEYPTLMLEIRGHDLGSAFPLKKIGGRTSDKLYNKFIKKVLANIFNQNSIMPLDLVEIFLILDEKMRQQVKAYESNKSKSIHSNSTAFHDASDSKETVEEKDSKSDDENLVQVEKQLCNLQYMRLAKANFLAIFCTKSSYAHKEQHKIFYSESEYQATADFEHVLGINKAADKLFKESKATIISESYHLRDHASNIQSMIEPIRSGEIDASTVICLERKQFGRNLGMRDVIFLAKILKHNKTCSSYEVIDIPEEITNMPIFYDAILYNEAKAAGISVVGIEGKGLASSKGDSTHNLEREEAMVANLQDITASGRSARFLVGSSHVDRLRSRVEESHSLGV